MSAPRFVYVISRPDGAHKVGVSADPATRRKGLGAGARIVRTFRCDAGAGRVESLAHDLLEALDLGGEWFAVDGRGAVEAVDKAIAIARENPRASGSRRSRLWAARPGYSPWPAKRTSLQEIWQRFVDEVGEEQAIAAANEANTRIENWLAQRRTEEEETHGR